MIVAFLLPERAGAAENPVGFMSRKPLQRPQPLRGYDTGRDQHVNMIRHHEGMQFVSVKSLLTIA